MQPFHLQSRIIIASMLAVLLTVAGGLWWMCARSDGIAFLPARSGAAWIVDPQPQDAMPQHAVPIKAVFWHTFTLDTPPAGATLAVCAFKSAGVIINGQTSGQLMLAGGKWKLPTTADVTGLLRAGTNEISVCVTNSLGPPALWLRLQIDGTVRGTDERWQVSLAGDEWQNARRATQSPTLQPGNLLYGSEQTMDSAKRVWPVMAMLCAASLVLVLGVSRWIRQRGEPAPAPASAPSAKLIYGLFIIVVIARTALFINNLPQLPRFMGFDAKAHEQYIQFIQEKHALPLPKDGWEMHQPPLYYLFSAALLDVCGYSVPDDDAAFVLRGVNGAVGLIHCWLALLCFRLLFPKRLSAQAVGLLVAAFLPPHLYLSQYVTNEPLAGLLVTVSFYFCLRALRAERASVWLHAGIGVALGAAMLTKSSALLAVPLLTAALGLRLLARRNHSPRDWLESVGVVVLSLLFVCGWHYGHIWAHFGRPIVGNWDKDVGFSFWQDPGFRTSAYYFRFGQVLVSPLFSAFHSFGDGICSTLWGDGLASGVGNLIFRPPWNYDLMNAGYLLGFAVSLLAIAGLVVSLAKFIRKPKLEWFMVLGLPFAFFLGILYMSLRVPFMSEAKAFYAFPALVPFSALVAVGWNRLGQKYRAVRTALWVVLLVWAMTVYAAFWIRGSNSETWRLRGICQEERQSHAEAFESLSQALRLNPEDADAHWLLADFLRGQKKEGEAVRHYHEALRLRPDFPTALNNLAWVLATSPDDALRNGAEAVRLAERACELTHYGEPSFIGTLAAAYAEAGRFPEAVATAQRALRVAETQSNTARADAIQSQLKFYQAGIPFHSH
ncbi:MAG: glycosyltransferase family 39 protein [Verrucomicrobiota bacterium]